MGAVLPAKELVFLSIHFWDVDYPATTHSTFVQRRRPDFLCRHSVIHRELFSTPPCDWCEKRSSTLTALSLLLWSFLLSTCLYNTLQDDPLAPWAVFLCSSLSFAVKCMQKGDTKLSPGIYTACIKKTKTFSYGTEFSYVLGIVYTMCVDLRFSTQDKFRSQLGHIYRNQLFFMCSIHTTTLVWHAVWCSAKKMSAFFCSPLDGTTCHRTAA